MAMRFQRLVVSSFVAFVSLSAVVTAGCGGVREPLYAPASLVGDTVLVRIKDAYVKGNKVVVKAYMTNETEHPISIDRDGIALRTADGELVPRASGRTTRHVAYDLVPGEGRDVHVDFRLPSRDADLRGMSLVLGGISTDEHPEPGVVGEIALSTEFRLAGEPVHRTKPREIDEASESAPREPADRDDDGDDEDDGEDWEVGDAG
jgi:hypothetical protein